MGCFVTDTTIPEGEDVIEYHKIQSVFLRDPANNMKTFLLGQYTTQAFAFLANNRWLFSEKIDGTNVRVLWDGNPVRFGGRTDDAQMSVSLMERLQSLFPIDKMAGVFPDAIKEEFAVMLFGEGFGAKIQKGGGNYKRDGVDFILFDVMIGGLYLERHNVEDIAAKLGIGVVPIVGTGTIADAIDMVAPGFASTIGIARAEGLVLRPEVELFDRRGHRVITKIKTKDFQ